MRKKTLIIILTVIAVCGAIIAAAAMNADKIMMRFSPEMYISYRAMNTIKQIEKEQEMIDEALPDLRDLSDSHNLSAKINLNDKAISFTEDYNEDIPSVVFYGNYDSIDFDGYITNNETAICMPSLLDVYFTFSTKNFGTELMQGGGDILLPVEVPEGFDLTLPDDNNEKDDIISDRQLLNIARSLIKEAEINHDSSDDYYLILKSENVKSALKNLAQELKNSPEIERRFNMLQKTTGMSASELIDSISASVESMELGDTIAVGYTERKNYVSRLEATLKDGDMSLTLSWNTQNKARLLEDYSVSVMTESNGSKVGIEYRESGSKFFKDEEKQDNRSVKVIFGNEEILNLGMELNYDKFGKALTGRAWANNLTADLNGTIEKENMNVNIENIMSGDENIGSASLGLTDIQHLQIKEKEKYPFKDLQLEDMAGLIELKGAQQ